MLTSRVSNVSQETKDWIDAHYKDIFSAIYFSGIYDHEDKDGTKELYKTTKADWLKKIGATYLIDDQPKHIRGAVDAGVAGVLYGDYAWNRDAVLPKGAVRCASWQSVGEYFSDLAR